MSELLSRFFSSDSGSIAAYLAGIYCLATAKGIARGIKFASFTFPSPKSKRMKLIMYGVGFSLIGVGLYRALRFPEYKPAVFEKWIYQGTDAKQIVADGEDLYLLKENGNIHRILQGSLPLADPGTLTRQIAAAGGALYILKDSGNIWAYQAVQPGSDKSDFQITDEGTGTLQIAVTGETLYVLKTNGNIWRSTIAPKSTGDVATVKSTADVATVNNKFILVDDGKNTKQITSSGSILYVLKEKGNIWKYAPTLGRAFEKIYDKGDAESIKADGGDAILHPNRWNSL
jgi:hypothetical protein